MPSCGQGPSPRPMCRLPAWDAPTLMTAPSPVLIWLRARRYPPSPSSAALRRPRVFSMGSSIGRSSDTTACCRWCGRTWRRRYGAGDPTAASVRRSRRRESSRSPHSRGLPPSDGALWRSIAPTWWISQMRKAPNRGAYWSWRAAPSTAPVRPSSVLWRSALWPAWVKRIGSWSTGFAPSRGSWRCHQESRGPVFLGG